MAGGTNAMVLKKAGPHRYFTRYVHDAVSRSITAENSLAWQLLDFFSNHFSVTANTSLMKFLAPTLEREAIAENLLGRFDNMLIAVISHPAMIIYLNNERSFGPGSRIGKRYTSRGLNENLARENSIRAETFNPHQICSAGWARQCNNTGACRRGK